ncbi:hypothetical protein D1159_05975 [Pseudoflavonifractor sp. 524-17]|uniref:hypothetical protein n=1 Tax=Pseudoflavonifractor sp. 524-17 TaxID=2304577 RepID=UPI00137B3F51|nr:hypothetical protein [Pseudoflavonifractor sp. 524-17]NCE64146.1 hypothetical protein [Pseudoflavonifractor sp. 524-17]
MAEIKNLLDEAIEVELNQLVSLSPDDEKKPEAIKNLTALHKLRIDEIKAAESEAVRACDEQFKRRQLSDQVIDRYVKIGLTAADLLLPLVFYGVWMKRGLKFEETGTFTSQTFKNLFNRFRPTRKS